MFRHNNSIFREYTASFNPFKVNWINLVQAWCVLPKDSIVIWTVGSMSLRNIGNCLHNVATQKTTATETSVRLISALSSRPIRDVTNETHSWAFQTNLDMSLILILLIIHDLVTFDVQYGSRCSSLCCQSRTPATYSEFVIGKTVLEETITCFRSFYKKLLEKYLWRNTKIKILKCDVVKACLSQTI